MSISSPRTKKLVFALIPAVVVVFLVGCGILLGRYLVLRKTSQLVDGYVKSRFLGGVLKKHLRADIPPSYKNPAHALENLDNFSWAPRNVPAPFVGSIPMPDEDRRVGINSMGFRCDHELAIPKPEGLCRIFVTGGSTAYGSGAPDAKRTIGGYLQSFLDQEFVPSGNMACEVVVAANPAWASTHERILIENRISELEPDLIVSFSGNNDVHWGRLQRDVMWFRTYADEHFFRLVKFSYEMSGHSLSGDVVKAVDHFVDPNYVAQALKKNVALSSHVLSREEVPFFFMIQPNMSVSGKPLSEREERHMARVTGEHGNIREYFRDCYSLIRETLAGMNDPNLRFVDLSGIFDKYGKEDEIFLDSHHFGDRGNEIIAKAIFENIRPSVEQIRSKRQGPGR